MVRIAYDDTVAAINTAGTGIYAARVRDELALILQERFALLRFGQSRGHLGAVQRKVATVARDIWWWQYQIIAKAKNAHADVLHIPASVGPVFGRMPLVVTIHDISVLRFPWQFRPWFRHYSAFVVPRVARSAGAVVTSSEASKEDIVAYLRLDAERVFVAPAGVDPGFAPVAPADPGRLRVRAQYAIPERFILTIGAIEPRKNLSRLLRAFHRVRGMPGLQDLHLVHVGPSGWLADDVRTTLVELVLSEAVHFLGYVPRHDIPFLLSEADLFVYPSLFEGFGLPVLEAMACGCPVLTSNVSSLPEVGGDAVWLADPLSVTSIADGIIHLLHHDADRSGMRVRGLNQAARFSWRRAAEHHLRAYDKAAAQ